MPAQETCDRVTFDAIWFLFVFTGYCRLFHYIATDQATEFTSENDGRFDIMQGYRLVAFRVCAIPEQYVI